MEAPSADDIDNKPETKNMPLNITEENTDPYMDFVSISGYTYKEIYPRLSEKEKKILPLYVIIGDTALICQTPDQFRLGLQDLRSRFIFLKGDLNGL
jgi:hypothetical protein